MNIKEEQKQEADRIVDTYQWLNTEDGQTAPFAYDYAVRFAIQDRQSVLGEVTLVFNNCFDELVIQGFLEQRIQSLTNQIEYLKTKL